MEHAPHRFPVTLAPVLGRENGSGSHRRGKEHVLDKLDLCCQGNRGHLILGHAAQHQRVAGRHRRQHQALEGDRQRQPGQFLIKCPVVNLHAVLLKYAIVCFPCPIIREETGFVNVFVRFSFRWNYGIISHRSRRGGCLYE